MQASAEPLEGNKVKLQISLDEAEVDQAIEQAFKKIATQVRIPGFRPGKAPRPVLEAQIGVEAARSQALNDSLPDFYMRALDDTGTDAIASPSIEITDGKEGGPVTFEAEVEVRPVPNIAGYDGLKVEIPNPVPTDADIDEQIERMRAQHGELEAVERPAKAGDFVTIDVNGISNGEPVPGLSATDYSYEVGNKLLSLGEDFDGQVDGSKPGDIKEFTSTVPPNDDEVEFRILVKAINERKLPELNDEFANEASEFDTLVELREDVGRQIGRARQAQAEGSLRTEVIRAIAELVIDDIPEPLVDAEMQRQLRDIANRLAAQGVDLNQFLEMTGQDQETFVAQLRSNATDSVRADLALRALADKEDIQATEDEVDAEIDTLAEQFGQKASRVRKDLEHADQMPAVRSDIRKAKAVTWLMDHVEIVDAEGKQIDRSAIRPEAESGETVPNLEATV